MDTVCCTFAFGPFASRVEFTVCIDFQGVYWLRMLSLILALSPGFSLSMAYVSLMAARPSVVVYLRQIQGVFCSSRATERSLEPGGFKWI